MGHHRGQSLPQLAAVFAVHYATVYDWLGAWQQHGVVGLAEGHRADRPPKLPETVQKSNQVL
ncbi:helix-turn-helix domain-containing protein [Hymenobacter terrenus]|uniref:helix-turn-helix domain-containing protein n=1 Tax=Hymenobacter terrenus TaxID=1629124 RepID=UPI0009080D2F